MCCSYRHDSNHYSVYIFAYNSSATWAIHQHSMQCLPVSSSTTRTTITTYINICIPTHFRNMLIHFRVDIYLGCLAISCPYATTQIFLKISWNPTNVWDEHLCNIDVIETIHEHPELFGGSGIVAVAKSRRLNWAGHVVRMDKIRHPRNVPNAQFYVERRTAHGLNVDGQEPYEFVEVARTHLGFSDHQLVSKKISYTNFISFFLNKFIVFSEFSTITVSPLWITLTEHKYYAVLWIFLMLPAVHRWFHPHQQPVAFVWSWRRRQQRLTIDSPSANINE